MINKKIKGEKNKIQQHRSFDDLKKIQNNYFDKIKEYKHNTAKKVKILN